MVSVHTTGNKKHANNRMNNMRFMFLRIVIILIYFVILSNPGISAPAKLAQTGFQFLSVGSDARAGAMANTMTTLDVGSSSLFFNPAGMARMKTIFDVAVSQNNWIDDIKYNSYSIGIRPFSGKYGVLGIAVTSVDYGEVQGTMVWQNEQGYLDTEIMRPTAFSMGLGYAKMLTDKFAVGGQIKYTGQQLGKSVVSAGLSRDSMKVTSNLAYATAFDFGTIYKTGWKSLAFGMSVRNFSKEIKYETDQFELPLTFRIGISMDVMDLIDENTDAHSLLVSIDALHPRSYPEQVNVGLEYVFMKTFLIRSGMFFNRDEENMTFGFGIHKFGFSIDYAYTPYGVFNNVQRFTFKFAL